MSSAVLGFSDRIIFGFLALITLGTNNSHERSLKYCASSIQVMLMSAMDLMFPALYSCMPLNKKVLPLLASILSLLILNSLLNSSVCIHFSNIDFTLSAMVFCVSRMHNILNLGSLVALKTNICAMLSLLPPPRPP